MPRYNVGDYVRINPQHGDGYCNHAQGTRGTCSGLSDTMRTFSGDLLHVVDVFTHDSRPRYRLEVHNRFSSLFHFAFSACQLIPASKADFKPPRVKTYDKTYRHGVLIKLSEGR